MEIYVKLNTSEDTMTGDHGWTGYDAFASIQKFEEMVEETLQRQYPDAEIIIKNTDGETEAWVDGDTDGDTAETVKMTIANAWQSFEWIKERE